LNQFESQTNSLGLIHSKYQGKGFWFIIFGSPLCNFMGKWTKSQKIPYHNKHFFGGYDIGLPLYLFKKICNGAPYNFWMKILMIKWKFIGLGMIFALFLNEYYGIPTKVNKRHYMSKILNFKCHIRPNWWNI
jgi:hypothetical protein